MTARHIYIVTGQVQGVGFRPFIYREAAELGLTGFVGNTPEGVRIEVQGEEAEKMKSFRPIRDSVLSIQGPSFTSRSETETISVSIIGANKVALPLSKKSTARTPVGKLIYSKVRPVFSSIKERRA